MKEKPSFLSQEAKYEESAGECMGSSGTVMQCCMQHGGEEAHLLPFTSTPALPLVSPWLMDNQ
jgi:hypothetical protein